LIYNEENKNYSPGEIINTTYKSMVNLGAGESSPLYCYRNYSAIPNPKVAMNWDFKINTTLE
jgi:hypothetical protein